MASCTCFTTLLMVTEKNYYTKQLRITNYQSYKSFQTQQQSHKETCTYSLGDTWQLKQCSKIVSKYQSCLIYLDWMNSYYKAKEFESVLTTQFFKKSVNSDCIVYSSLYISFCVSFLNVCVVFRSRKWIIWSTVLWQWHSWWKSSGQCAPAAHVGPVSAQPVVLTPQ